MKKQDLASVTLPETPGVYFFYDKDGAILYIGKATSLHDRVKSYFNQNIVEARGLKILTMLTLAAKVGFQETGSVLEALLLENVLIKKHNPPYNTKEKDNKSYMTVVITKEPFPRVLTMRVRDYEKRFKKGDVQAVYGPFASGTQLRDAMKMVRKIFPYRDTCEESQGTPCFNAQLGLCPGVCSKSITSAAYKKTITRLKQFFEGRRQSVKLSLTREMQTAIKKQEFEGAAKLRDTLFAIDHIKDTSLIKDDTITSFKDSAFRIECFDAAHLSGFARNAVMAVIEGGRPQTGEYRLFKLEDGVNDDYEALATVLSRRFKHTEWRYPDLVVVDGGEAHKRVAEEVIIKLGLLIPVLAVVKDERHKPKDILGRRDLVNNHKKEVLLGNGEAHRFAVAYHKKLRSKNFIAR